MENSIRKISIGKVLSTFLALGLLSACSDTEFAKKDFSAESYTVQVGQVDILFVVDNSGSMSQEQRRMADSFPNFVQGLDLAGLDYRIGIVTTDVESTSNPKVNDGVLQNGNLIQFTDGSYFLSPESKNIETQFWNTIQRPETLTCENSGYNTSLCPSDDERGIYSAYLAVNANKKDFFRKNGHVAFVFLSDEDVRGEGVNNHPYRQPVALDYPENLIQVVKTRLGNNTDISAHAIVTDSVSCRQQQMAQGGNSNIHGVIGQFYINMANPGSPSNISGGVSSLSDFAGGQLVQGVVGSICADNYVAELGSIKEVLSKTKKTERLRCPLFEKDDLNVRVSGDYTWTLNANLDEITFTPALKPGDSFKLDYECP
jgi:hypothetical protein